MRRRPSGTEGDGEGGARVDSNSSILTSPPADLMFAPVTTADAPAAAAYAHSSSSGGGAGGGGAGANSSAVDDDTDSDDAGIDTAELLALIEQAEQSQASETPQPGGLGVRALLTRRTSAGARKSDVRVSGGSSTAPQPRRSPRKSGVGVAASPSKHAKVPSPNKGRSTGSKPSDGSASGGSTGSKPSDGSASGGSSGAIRDISNMLSSAAVNTDPEASQGASGSSSGGQ